MHKTPSQSLTLALQYILQRELLTPAGRDFGGSRESIDIDAEATAAREFAEETLGVFASMAVNACAVAQSSESMAQQLRARTHALEIKRPLKQVRVPPAQNTCSRLIHPSTEAIHRRLQRVSSGRASAQRMSCMTASA